MPRVVVSSLFSTTQLLSTSLPKRSRNWTEFSVARFLEAMADWGKKGAGPLSLPPWGHAPFSKREGERGFFYPFFYFPLCVIVRRFSPSDVDGHQASNQWATSSSARIVCHSRVTSGNDVSRSASIRNLIRRGIALFSFFNV